MIRHDQHRQVARVDMGGYVPDQLVNLSFEARPYVMYR